MGEQARRLLQFKRFISNFLKSFSCSWDADALRTAWKKEGPRRTCCSHAGIVVEPIPNQGPVLRLADAVAAVPAINGVAAAQMPIAQLANHDVANPEPPPPEVQERVAEMAGRFRFSANQYEPKKRILVLCAIETNVFPLDTKNRNLGKRKRELSIAFNAALRSAGVPGEA